MASSSSGIGGVSPAGIPPEDDKGKGKAIEEHDEEASKVAKVVKRKDLGASSSSSSAAASSSASLVSAVHIFPTVTTSISSDRKFQEAVIDGKQKIITVYSEDLAGSDDRKADNRIISSYHEMRLAKQDPILYLRSKANGSTHLAVRPRNRLRKNAVKAQKTQSQYSEEGITYNFKNESIIKYLNKIQISPLEYQQLLPFFHDNRSGLLEGFHLMTTEAKSEKEKPALYLRTDKGGTTSLGVKQISALDMDRAKALTKKGKCFQNDIQYNFSPKELMKYLDQQTLSPLDCFHLSSFVREHFTLSEPTGFLTQQIRSYREARQPETVKQVNAVNNIICSGMSYAVVDATYPDATMDVICDWISMTARGGIMHVDGTGHNNAAVVREEHPVLNKYAQKYSNFVRDFNFSHPDALKKFMIGEDALFQEFNLQMHHILQTRAARKIEIGERASHFHEKVASGSFTEEEFNQYCAFLDTVAVAHFIENHEASFNEYDKKISACFKHVVSGNFEEFKKALAPLQEDLGKLKSGEIGTDHLGYKDIRQMGGLLTKFANMHKKEASSTGSAFGLVQPIPYPDGDLLFARNVTDVCFLVVCPSGDGFVYDPENGIDPNSVNTEWVDQSDKILGTRGDEYKSQLLGPFPKGAVALSFSDGIGEFLTKEEILEVFLANFGKGPEEMTRAIKREIEDKSTLGESYDRIRASETTGRGKSPCKPLDPKNEQFHDDISFGITYVNRKDPGLMFRPGRVQPRGIAVTGGASSSSSAASSSS